MYCLVLSVIIKLGGADPVLIGTDLSVKHMSLSSRFIAVGCSDFKSFH